MFVSSIREGLNGTFEKPDDAISYMVENNFEYEITVYDTNSNRAYEKTSKIYEYIKEYNKGKPLDDQILPTNPFGFRGILGCLGVKCYTIGLGKYKRNHQSIALFSGHKSSVLDTSNEDAHIVPSMKALTSLAMLGNMMR